MTQAHDPNSVAELVKIARTLALEVDQLKTIQSMVPIVRRAVAILRLDRDRLTPEALMATEMLEDALAAIEAEPYLQEN